MIWLPIEPHEARSFKLDRKLLVFFMNASSEMRHPAEKEGKKPKRLSFGKRESDEIRKEVYADVTRTMSAEQLKNLNTVQQLSAQINSMTSPWYLHFMRYDPTASLKKIKCPVLALNGEKDIQVDADMNLTAIKQHISENGNKNVTIKAYPKLNHLFQTCEKGTLAEYGQLEETINPEVLKDMTEWIKKQ